MALTVYLSSDNVILLTGLIDEVSSTYQNSATVTVTLKDMTDTEVSGESWPLTMAYVASSNGNYRATLADVLVLTNSTRYTAEVVADAGAGLKRTWYLPVVSAKSLE